MNTQTIELYSGMALSRIIEGTRLTGNTRDFFEAYAQDEAQADALQEQVFTECFKTVLDAGLYQQLSAQTVLKKIAEVCMILEDGELSEDMTPKEWKQYRNIAKHMLHAFVADGWMIYNPAELYLNEQKVQCEIPAHYVMCSQMLRRTISNMLHSHPKVSPRFIRKGTEHYDGALAMSAHKFSVNITRAIECADMLAKGYFLNKKEMWQAAEPTNEKEMAKLDQQRQALSQARIAYKTAPNGWHYEVKSDFRGRLYYVSGMLNPQAGGVALYILTHDDSTTYDSTASFAQFISVLTGDRNLADACNLTNYSDTVKDFYGNVYSIASGKPCPAKDSFEREVAKQYLMPKAYGSSDDASEARAIRMAEEAGFDTDAAAAIVGTLKAYDGLNKVKDAASRTAEEWAKRGEQLAWTTPTGFFVKQNYWEKTREEWNTNEADNEFIPTRITFIERTDTVKVDRNDEDKQSTATIAAAANFIQSLDAAFMAKVQARYYKETAETLIGIHDSFTLGSPLRVEVFTRIAWDCFIEIANSPELAEMRSIIGLPQKQLLWLNPNRIPRFIDKE